MDREPLVGPAPQFTRTRSETRLPLDATASVSATTSEASSALSVSASLSSSTSVSSHHINSTSSAQASISATQSVTGNDTAVPSSSASVTITPSTSHTLIFPENGFPSDFPMQTIESEKGGGDGRDFVFVDDDLADGMLLFLTFFGGLLVFSILLIKLAKWNSRHSTKEDTMLLDDDKPDFHDEYSPDYEKERFWPVRKPGAPRGV